MSKRGNISRNFEAEIGTGGGEVMPHSSSSDMSSQGLSSLQMNQMKNLGKHSIVEKEQQKINNSNRLDGTNHQVGGTSSVNTITGTSVVVNTSMSASSDTISSKKTADKYGLLGLLGVIKNEEKQALNILSLGVDLTTLGLNLNSPEYLYTTFASPLYDQASKIQPEFSIPKCYLLSNHLPLNKHFSKFQDETLFYMFYSMPKDILQAMAAKELMRRKWLYHMSLKQWFTRVSNTEVIKIHQGSEQGTYIFFEIQPWKKSQKRKFPTGI